MFHTTINYYSLLKEKNTENTCPRAWCTIKPFGYRVAHHGYLLTNCPGQTL